jgi:RNA polymerase sigma-70 factor (ECF subfamily)
MGLVNNGTERSDAQLVAQVLGGDDAAYGTLVERYRSDFARYATGLCGDSDLAADAMQEAFIKAYDGLASCRQPSRFKAWFFRILTNRCHNMRDRRRVHSTLEDVPVESSQRADDTLREGEIQLMVQQALDVLTPEQREAFVLKHVDGYSYAEISNMLGEGVDALKMRVYRARDVVKKQLERLL